MMASRVLVVLLVAVVVQLIQSEDVPKPPKRAERAIGGQNFRRGTWPWLALLKATIVTERLFGIFPIRHYHIYCGGTLISDRWLLTAAHCFTENGERATRPFNWEARLAVVRLRPSLGQRVLDVLGRVLDRNDLRQWEVDVDRIIVHPGYNTTSLYNDDIALVRLSRPVPNGNRFSYIQNIPLPNEEDVDFPEVGQTCITKGWGCTARGGGPSSNAQQIEMPVYESRQCTYSYNLDTMNKRICAGYRNRGVGVCRGDSGGPLVCQKGNRYTLAGIVSFTSRNRPGSFPAVFTRVQDYIEWINSVTDRYS